MNTKKWSILLLSLTLVALTFLGGLTAVIDPFFHYHGPLSSLEYPLGWDFQRYINDGIVRHFDYDAIITGTSVTENFKASECDDLFGVRSIKVPYSGTTLTELYGNLDRAFAANDGIRLVIFSMDHWLPLDEPGLLRSDVELPLYLYDDNLFNDTQYLLNKEIFNSTIGVLDFTREGNTTTNFDDYSNWANSSYGATGRDILLRNYIREDKRDRIKLLEEDMRERLIENITNNTIRLARENPATQFYYFFPPYSVLRWDGFDRLGTMDRWLEVFELTSALMLQEPNIHLFAFYDDVDTVTNLEIYLDDVHYSADINSLILQRLSRGDGRLTLDNYQAYWQQIGEYYHSYDYDAIFE